jgi:hypothetical protein
VREADFRYLDGQGWFAKRVFPGLTPIFLSSRAHQRSEGAMRSIQSRNRNLGIQNARKSAKSIVRNASDRPSPRATGAFYGYASRSWRDMRDAVRFMVTTATCVMKTHVTGGACGALALQRSERHAHACRSAAR